MENKETELIRSAWKEKVYIETSEYIIEGYIYMPKIGKRTRLISDILNSTKNFIAIKDCRLEYKLYTTRPIEEHNFLEINLSSILLMRPLKD